MQTELTLLQIELVKHLLDQGIVAVVQRPLHVRATAHENGFVYGELGFGMFLRHISHVARNLALRYVVDGVAIHQHTAALGVKDAVDAFEQGGFACSIHAENAQDFPGMHAKGDVF